MVNRAVVPVVSLCCLAGCVAVEDPAEVGEVVAEIHGADDTPADLAAVRRAVALVRIAQGTPFRYCTGTMIDPFHLISAAHCLPARGDEVWFYDTSAGMSSARRRSIIRVEVPPGVNPVAEFQLDTTGHTADLLVATIDAPDPGALAATMVWTYPGFGARGFAVGAGQHDGATNAGAALRQIEDYTASPSDDTGHFSTLQPATDDGDSGGPFYTPSLRMIGVARGKAYDPTNVWRGKYTSVAEHLPWILDAMDYTWPGGPYLSRRRGGTAFQTFLAQRHVCEYACEKSPTCLGLNYNLQTDVCELMSSFTSSTASSTWVTTLR